ncbi:MAG: ribbon-helix-helix protein, CopG family [Candidatus Omnitrophica bacterium]|nr:ribbon-helix-helix protein, CopG family [Candidatus Omnitrophota bacterium]
MLTLKACVSTDKIFSAPIDDSVLRVLDELSKRLHKSKKKIVEEAIEQYAAGFYKKWNPSHGMDINNAVLAATVETCGGVLYTLNEKHYPVPSIVVEKAW